MPTYRCFPCARLVRKPKGTYTCALCGMPMRELTVEEMEHLLESFALRAPEVLRSPPWLKRVRGSPSPASPKVEAPWEMKVYEIPLTFENKAWKGIRLVGLHPLKKDNVEYYFVIGVHYPMGKFYVEVQRTYLERRPPETYAKHEFYGDSVSECLAWIEKTYGVKTALKDPPHVIEEQEKYVKEEIARLSEKYPSWRIK